jgi:hypothetical protein
MVSKKHLSIGLVFNFTIVYFFIILLNKKIIPEKKILLLRIKLYDLFRFTFYKVIVVS